MAILNFRNKEFQKYKDLFPPWLIEVQNVIRKYIDLDSIYFDKVYAREAKLYTILYDLFDQLSLEAGTRKLEKASSGNNLVVNTESGSTTRNNQIPFVGSDGVVGISSGTFSSTIESATFEPEGSNFQKFVQSGAVNPSTGHNASQNQIDVSKLTQKADWAKDWDFEKERTTVKRILEIPKITQFSGKAYSDQNTVGYSKLTLDWVGEHPIGIAEYSFTIDDYTEPVYISDVSSGGISSPCAIIGIATVSGLSMKYSAAGNHKTRLRSAIYKCPSAE